MCVCVFVSSYIHLVIRVGATVPFSLCDYFSLIFLGGPGSGKVTHCDTLMEEKRGVTHINMMDLLHQHVISNGTAFLIEFSLKLTHSIIMIKLN